MNMPYPGSAQKRTPFDKLALMSDAKLKTKIAKIKNANLANVSIDALKVQFKELLSYQIKLIVGYYYVYYYRAQKTTENSLARLVHPPRKLIKTLGRCNDIGESLFYCSNCYTTAILETKPQMGEKVTVLVLELPDLNNGAHSAPVITLARNEIKDDLMHPFPKTNLPQLNNRLEMIDDFFAEVMLQEVEEGAEWKYKASVALSKACFESNNNDSIGIAFPSLASKKFGVNLALTPTWFEKTSGILNRNVKAFRVEIVEKTADFNMVVLITEIAHEVTNDGVFLYKDVSNLNQYLHLNNAFYDNYELIFQNQKQALKKDSFFYRRYPPHFLQ